jgi:hypothetical protein
MAETMASPPPSPEDSTTLAGQGTKDEGGSSQLTHFHPFKDLPPELRQMIYKACLPRRTFRFSYGRGPWRSPCMKESFGKKPAALPFIAFVCKEAYHISKLFSREFEMNFKEVLQGHYSYGTTEIRFDLDLDTLLINHTGTLAGETLDTDHADHEDYLQNLHNGPFALAMNPKVNFILELDRLVGYRGMLGYSPSRIKWLTARPYWDYLTQRRHCTVSLASTGFFAKELEIRSSGLFGMFGEERSVFIDINDKAKIDQFENYVRQPGREGIKHGYTNSHFPELAFAGTPVSIAPKGSGRYARYGRAVFDFGRAHGLEDTTQLPTVLSVAGLHTPAEQDAASALYLIKQSWLEAHHCFEPAHNPLVPWTGNLR